MRALHRARRLASSAQAAAASQRSHRRLARAPAAAAKRSYQDELAELAVERASVQAARAPARAKRRLAIALYPSPVLRAPNADVTVFDAALASVAREMFTLMYKTDGVGLAAPQVGLNLRLMVYNPAGVPGEGEETVLCNPVLEESSSEEGVSEEGCLSFPGIYADVKARQRPARRAACAPPAD
jgi:peptide deformylase